MTAEEFKKVYLSGYKPAESKLEAFVPKSTETPDSVDWVNAGYVTGIKD